MHIIALCPTFSRPALVANTLAQFLDEKLRAGDTAHLHIWDDSGCLQPQAGFIGDKSWEIESTDTWVPLTQKYNIMLRERHMDVVGDRHVLFSVRDDDDCFLPWHLHAQSLAADNFRWVHPTEAYSTCGVNLDMEPPGLKRLKHRSYHSALAIRGDLLETLGGWPETVRSDYDKQQLKRCMDIAGTPGNPIRYKAPSYVYCWSATGHQHISAYIRNGHYPQPRRHTDKRDVWIEPTLMDFTEKVRQWMGVATPTSLNGLYRTHEYT